ncbi:MAG: hypothetical protein M3014_12255, partial [Chloroflexota bacterium]|nr:hypothetical protein [Chloroflexota bacterium]
AYDATLTRQTFQHGSMLGVLRYNPYSNHSFEEIHALFDDKTAQSYHIFPIDIDPDTPLPTSSIGSYKSTTYLAGVWSQNAELKSKLGNPTGNAVTMVAASSGAGGVPIKYFIGGFMIYPDPTRKEIYVLTNESGQGYDFSQGPHLQYANVDHWEVYPDTYQP